MSIRRVPAGRIGTLVSVLMSRADPRPDAGRARAETSTGTASLSNPRSSEPTRDRSEFLTNKHG